MTHHEDLVGAAAAAAPVVTTGLGRGARVRVPPPHHLAPPGAAAPAAADGAAAAPAAGRGELLREGGGQERRLSGPGKKRPGCDVVARSAEGKKKKKEKKEKEKEKGQREREMEQAGRGRAGGGTRDDSYSTLRSLSSRSSRTNTRRPSSSVLLSPVMAAAACSGASNSTMPQPLLRSVPSSRMTSA